MSNILWKNFHLCLPKFMCLPLSPPPPPNQDHNPPPPFIPSTTSMIIKNFNTLFDLTSPETFSASTSTSDSDSDTPPDFATVVASQRFFFSSPGSSNSIIDSTDTPPQEPNPLAAGGIAVSTYSPDPYRDFRRSMQEMIEARSEYCVDEKSDWEYLHELLLCYLSLNPKHTHKFIIGAFSDLVVTLFSSSSETNSRLRRSAVSRRLVL